MPVESRKVFISWSKTPTDRVASGLARLLNHMFDNVEPFVSKDNVAFGSLSIGEIHRELAGTSFGILVVSRANQEEPWLNFEAGSLAKTIPEDSDARVVPLLIDHESIAQLTGPIANLQAALADEVGVRRLFLELADVLKVDAAVFESRWSAGWEAFSSVLEDAKAELAQGPSVSERSAEDMLEEIVTLLRTRPATSTGSRKLGLTPDDSQSREIHNLVTRTVRKQGAEVRSTNITMSSSSPRVEVTFVKGSVAGADHALQISDALRSVLPLFDVRLPEFD